MANPWEEYQAQPSAAPWTQYQGQSAKENGESSPGIIKRAISTLQGPTMGFADELAGVGGAIAGSVANLTPYGDGKTFAENYRDTRDAARAASESHLKENPVLGHAERIVASLPVMAAQKVGQAVQTVPGLLNQTGRAVGSAAAYGLASGAGDSTSDSASGVAMDAALSSALSGVLGPVIGAVAKPVMNVAGNVSQRIAGSQIGGNVLSAVNSAGTRAANGIEDAAYSIGTKIADGGNGVRDKIADAVAAAGWNAGKAIDAITPAVDGGSRRYAMEKVAEAIARDKAGIADPLLRAQSRLGKLGDEATIADSAGQNTRQLLDTLATLPGETKNAAEALIHARQAGRAGRLIGAAEEGLSPNGARLPATLEALSQQRAAASRHLYDRVNQTDVAIDPELAGMLQRAKGAMGQAKELAKVTGEKFDIDDGVSQVINSLTLSPGQKTVPLRQLDMLKKSLYDIEQKHVSEETGKLNSLGNAYKDLRRSLTDKLDSLTVDPTTGQSFYKSARDAYAGPTQLRQAANLGNQAISKDAWKIAEITDGMSQSELSAFRVGAFESLRKKFGTEGGQTQMLKMWKEPATAEKLKELFSNEGEFRKFAATVAKEARLKGLESVGRGSQTAARAAGIGDVDMSALSEAGNIARSAATGNLSGLVGSANNLWNRVQTPESVRNEMGNILMSRGAKGSGNINELRQVMEQVKQERARRASQAGIFAGML